MDRLDKYRDVIKKILTEYHGWASNSNIRKSESCLVFDEVHDQYFWFLMGWQDKRKYRNIQVHIRIKNQKIYIEDDWTEEGIPKSYIVLAFHDPETRKLTEFAVA